MKRTTKVFPVEKRLKKIEIIKRQRRLKKKQKRGRVLTRPVRDLAVFDTSFDVERFFFIR